jgi:hypothetical protein
MKQLNGSTWQDDPTFPGFSPVGSVSLVADATNLFVASAWTAAPVPIYRKNGTNWTSSTSGGPGSPKLAIGNGKAYYLYLDHIPSSNSIHVSTFNGSLWTNLKSSATDSTIASGVGYSDIEVGTDGSVWVAFSATVGTSTQVHVRRWTGTTWSGTNDVLGGAAFSNFSLCVLNGAAYVAYAVPNSNQLSVVSATNKAKVGATILAPGNATVGTFYLDGSSGSLIAVASAQNASGNYSQYGWKYNGTVWNQLGSSAIGTAAASGMSFTMHQGQPVVGFIDAAGSKVFRYSTTAP